VVLILLVTRFFPTATPMVMGSDETTAHRRGHQLTARGVDRDPVRSRRELLGNTNINAGGQTPVSQSADDALHRPLVTMTNTVVFQRHSPTLLMLNWPRNRRCVVKNEAHATCW
jgi:hypothetical protein